MDDTLSANLARNLRQLRGQRRYTQERLSVLSGVPRPTIAHLESGSANPTLSVLARVSSALQVSIEELVSTPSSMGRLYTADELPVRRQRGVELRQLVPDAIPGITAERMAFEPHARLTGAPHLPGTREYLICERGSVQLTTLAERWVLSPGDVVVYRGDQSHGYANLGDEPAVAYTVILPSA